MTASRFVGAMAVSLLGAVVLQSQAAQAQLAPYPSKARSYKVYMARAMDECIGPFVTVVNPGAVGACAQANTVTDSSITGAIKALLNITSGNSGVKMSLVGSGFTPPAQRVAVRLTLRTTNTLGSPSGSKTYEDVTVDCGSVAGGTCGHYFPSDPSGRINGRTTLADCAAGNTLSSDLAAGNIEFLDTALINCDSGKVIARPGLKK